MWSPTPRWRGQSRACGVAVGARAMNTGVWFGCCARADRLFVFRLLTWRRLFVCRLHVDTGACRPPCWLCAWPACLRCRRRRAPQGEVLGGDAARHCAGDRCAQRGRMRWPTQPERRLLRVLHRHLLHRHRLASPVRQAVGARARSGRHGELWLVGCSCGQQGAHGYAHGRASGYTHRWECSVAAAAADMHSAMKSRCCVTNRADAPNTALIRDCKYR